MNPKITDYHCRQARRLYLELNSLRYVRKMMNLCPSFRAANISQNDLMNICMRTGKFAGNDIKESSVTQTEPAK